MLRSPLFGAAMLALFAVSACGEPADPAMKEMARPEADAAAAGPAEPELPEANEAHDDHEADAHDAHDAHDDHADHADEADAHAHEAQSGERLAAHEHGAGTLAAALDGDQLTFTFEAPLASLVGFEHEPETGEQAAALEALEDAFVLPGAMVAINDAAECLPQTTTSGTHIAGGHGALEVEHVYTCTRPGRIETIEFLMLGAYPALETVDAVFLSGASQSAGELTAASPVLRVR